MLIVVVVVGFLGIFVVMVVVCRFFFYVLVFNCMILIFFDVVELGVCESWGEE